MTKTDIKIKPDHIRFRDTKHYDTGLHAHNDLQITISLEHSSCEVTWIQEDGSYEQKMIAAGRVCIIPPMLEHRFNWMNKAHFINLHIKQKTICSIIDGLYEPEDLNLQEVFGAKDDFIHNIALGMRQTILHHGQKAEGFYRSSLDLVAHYVYQTYAIDHKRDILFNDLEQIPCAKIRDAVNFIFNNINRNLSVEDIAKAADMSQFHFLRTFKKMIGMSATRFHMVQRLEKAKDLLINSEQPIAAIANELGFSSQAYFSTNFSKYIGTSPAKFRRQKQR